MHADSVINKDDDNLNFGNYKYDDSSDSNSGDSSITNSVINKDDDNCYDDDHDDYSDDSYHDSYNDVFFDDFKFEPYAF